MASLVSPGLLAILFELRCDVVVLGVVQPRPRGSDSRALLAAQTRLHLTGVSQQITA
jgi:hypothetical protein